STGRNELAYEIQDVCTGGSQPGGVYHRHALSECTPHVHDRVALVGYALDGFGIYSPYDADGRELTTADLDECHGTTSEIEWDGQRVVMYHYVMTRDYPFTIGCFRGTPTRNAFPAMPRAACGSASPSSSCSVSVRRARWPSSLRSAAVCNCLRRSRRSSWPSRISCSSSCTFASRPLGRASGARESSAAGRVRALAS